MASSPDITQLAQEAQSLKAKLEVLWADEGVAQLNIFLDPEITDVLAEIKQISLDFIDKVAQAAE